MVPLTRSTAACAWQGGFRAASGLQSRPNSKPPGHRSRSPRRFVSTSPGASGDNSDARPGSDLKFDKRSTGPTPWPSSPRPTPYDIFGHARHVPYDKTRFYQLVKQYHPDRHQHSVDDGIPDATKLERYRLVVAANHILSHPSRRRLYDRHGLGWAEHLGEREDPNAQCRAADHAWRTAPGSPHMNATWEDWERWRQQRDGTWQEPPMYVSNGAFATIAVMLAVIGAWGHVAYGSTSRTGPLSMHEERHAAIGAEMRRRQSELEGISRDARVESFVRQREHDLMAAHMRQAGRPQLVDPAKGKTARD